MDNSIGLKGINVRKESLNVLLNNTTRNTMKTRSQPGYKTWLTVGRCGDARHHRRMESNQRCWDLLQRSTDHRNSRKQCRDLYSECRMADLESNDFGPTDTLNRRPGVGGGSDRLSMSRERYKSLTGW